MPLPLRLTALGLAALLAVGGCRVHDVNEHPEPPVSVPASYGAESTGAAQSDRWWQNLGAPELDALVERAVRASPRMLIAWARLKQAEALSDSARAPRWPTLDLQASAAYRENFFPPFGVIDQRTYSLSLPAAYELDLWNKYGAGAASAVLNVRASRGDVEATAMSVAAEVAEAWFDIVQADAQKKLLDEQLESNRTYEELVQMRFDRGIAAALDVYQQRQQRLAVEAQLVLLESPRAQALNRLAVLLGEPRKALTLPTRDQLPELAALPALGVPADLLERRPDVRAARDRIVAQDYQVAAAIAARLPTLIVNGSLSFSAKTPKQLFDAFLKSISGTLAAPIFDAGKRAAEVRRQRAVLEESIANYAQVLLTAMNEVDTALALEQQQTRSLAVLREQHATADASLREARARYEQGLSDYLPVLTALASLQSVERTLLDAQRQLLSARVQLCRALGGTWTLALQRTREEKPT